MDVTVEKSGNVFGVRRNFVLLQDADDNAGIRHPRDFDIPEIVLDSKPFFERAFQRFDARASGVD